MRYQKNNNSVIRLSCVYILPHSPHSYSAFRQPQNRLVYPCGYALFRAAYCERGDDVVALLALGSDVNVGVPGMSVLSCILVGKWNNPLLQLVMDAGADPNNLTDRAITKMLLYWDSKMTVCVTDRWSQETVDRAMRLTGLFHLPQLRKKRK